MMDASSSPLQVRWDNRLPREQMTSKIDRGCYSLLALLLGVCCAQLSAEPAEHFTLSSSAFTDGGTLPVDYTCDGQRASPPLQWSGAPAGTKSFAITMHHIPGPGDKHVYMVIYNIPADVRSIEKNSKDVGLWGINTVNGQQEYTPPCSKGPGPKKYTMTVYALSAEPKFEKPADQITMDDLLAAIKDTTLATSAISVTYSRPGNDAADGPGGGPPGGGDQSGGQGANARQPRTPPEQQALKNIQLSNDQKAKVDDILKDYRDKQDKLRAQLLEEMKAVLTDDQYQQYEAAMHRPPRPPQQ
jgi:phosphatidylethanolamine-binding protein (PEBP) family uncharacterized protein